MRPPDIHAPTSAPAANRGAALVITLAILVLITFLVVALFTTVTNERVESSAAANRGDVEQLTAATVDLVKATITQATAGYESANATGALDTAKRMAWASQPGLIRTWSQDGNPYRSYRLYSGGNLATGQIAVDGALDVSADAPSAGWKTGGTSYNALWSDLNAPVANSTNTSILNYPIVTPPADTESGSVAIDATNGVPTDDPATAEQEGVQGFAITDAPGFSAGASPGPTNNPAPMPVKWLYVLKDGTFVSPTGTGAVATVAGASKTNPIVGRVAYWTDDETCKVNINTASEGYYWDKPYSAGRQETALAANGPVHNEWQRIPGHPASTSLSAVFEEFSGRTTNDFQRILQLTPRTGWGGSQNGTRPMGLPAVFNPGGFFYQGIPGLGSANPAQVPAPPPAITLPTRRLYATADEFFYSSTNSTANPPVRQQNSTNLPPEDVARSSFFLTASSRAPDVNMFDQPRISLWPITWINTVATNGGDWGSSRTSAPFPPIPSTADPSTVAITTSMPPSMLPSERLIAFASSVGRSSVSGIPYRYFFTRQFAMDPAHDFDNIRRNQELFDYLRDVTSRDLPGFGRSLEDRWGARERTQILASCFDYLRGSVNLNTSIYSPGAVDNLATNSYFYTPRAARQTGVGTDPGSLVGGERLSSGQVIPIRIQRDGHIGHGAGRTPIITEAALVFYAKERQDPVTGITNVLTTNVATGLVTSNKFFVLDPTKLIGTNGSQTTQLGCFLLLEMFNPIVGLPFNTMNNYAVRVSGQPFTVNGNSLGFPSITGDINLVSGAIDTSQRRDSSTNPTTGFFTPLVGTVNAPGGGGDRKQAQKIAKKGTFSDKYYPFFGEVSVSPSATNFSFSGSSNVIIELLAPNTGNRAGGLPSSASVFQTYSLDFSQLNGSYPMPRAPRFNAAPGSVTTSTFETNTANSAFGLMMTNAHIFQRGEPTVNANNNLIKPINTANSVMISNSVPTVPNDEVVTALEEGTNFKWYYQFTDQLTNGFGFFLTNKVSGYIDNDVKANIKRSHTDLNFRLWFAATTDGDAAGGVSPSTCVITPYDTIISLSLDGYDRPGDPPGTLGDPRLVAVTRDVPSAWYRPIDPRLQWSPISAFPTPSTPYAAGTNSKINFTAPTPTVWKHLLSGGNHGGTGAGIIMNTPSGRTYYQNFMPTNFSLTRCSFDSGGFAVSGRFRSLNESSLPGAMDWTGGDGGFPDGAIIAKPSEQFFPVTLDNNSYTFMVQFFTYYNFFSEEARFSPNSQMVSAVQFGSLPTGSFRGQPWQTLLFSPNPAAGSSHPGFDSPPDHLLLDLFSMPVVEPYPISEPLSTAGRINLNYQIAPFNYVVRKTGHYALLKSLQMPILTRIQSANYKYLPEMNQLGWGAGGSSWDTSNLLVGGRPAAGSVPEPSVSFPALGAGTRTRYSINIDETLKGFDQRFASGDAFRSASEICEMFLVPRTDDTDPAGTTPISGIPTTLVGLKNGWWTSSNFDHSPTITGDNLRESPYNQLYPRVTTKSNTFTVYYRVQTLKQTGAAGWDKWDEAKDVVLSESRGSETIERYVDPNDTSIPDFADPANYSKNLAPYYRWRTLASKQFVP